MFEEYERIDNIELIFNNLRHIEFELASGKPSPMRIAKESHQLLLRVMVEALRGTANLNITGRPSKDRKRWYHNGDCHWYAIQKVKVAGCQKAWRYSEPKIETPPVNEPPKDHKIKKAKSEPFLLGFYDLLAMIQAPCFMIRFVNSCVISLTTEDMQCLEWLHEEIRNEFEHFTPNLLLSSSEDCLISAKICIRTASMLLFDSGNIIHATIDELKVIFERLLIQIQKVILRYTRA